jgi:hypothetical protein
MKSASSNYFVSWLNLSCESLIDCFAFFYLTAHRNVPEITDNSNQFHPNQTYYILQSELSQKIPQTIRIDS